MTQSGPGFDGFLQRLGDAIGALQGVPGGAHRRVWAELGPWLRSLTMEAAPSWLQRLGAQQPCHVVDYTARRACTRHAVALCSVCVRPTCLEHAFINRMGEAICYVCATAAMPNRAAPPPIDPTRARQKELQWARQRLKVTASATLDEIRRAHRKLSGELHPDKFHTERERAQAEKRFKDVQRAYDLLRSELERGAA